MGWLGTDRRTTWMSWLLSGLLAAVGGIATERAPEQPGRLVPAESKYPAAGICLPPTGRLVVVRINPDTPDPRCAKVTRAQRLRVVNATNGFGHPGQKITVRFADFAPRVVAVGEATTYHRPFGDYLARGDHVLQISLYGGGGADVCLCPWISAE